MELNTDHQVLHLAQELLTIQSDSVVGTEKIFTFLESYFRKRDWQVEVVESSPKSGVTLQNIVAKHGEGEGGCAFLSHFDTVTAEPTWSACLPEIKDGRLIGRGSCDMKGPLAAAIVAAEKYIANNPSSPVLIAISADEESEMSGARAISEKSRLLAETRPSAGIVTEPTSLVPVSAHKGIYTFVCKAYGKSAHTSTEHGLSSNFQMAPFFAEMAHLRQQTLEVEKYKNSEFTPSTNGFNVTINDGNCLPNVTASMTECVVTFRPMPDDASDQIAHEIRKVAARNNLHLEERFLPPFFQDPSSELVKMSLEICKVTSSTTAPYATEAPIYQSHFPVIVLGPGSIIEAHTIGESIGIAELLDAVEVYGKFLSACLSGSEDLSN